MTYILLMVLSHKKTSPINIVFTMVAQKLEHRDSINFFGNPCCPLPKRYFLPNGLLEKRSDRYNRQKPYVT